MSWLDTLLNSIGLVRISGSPSAGQVLTATSATDGQWKASTIGGVVVSGTPSAGQVPTASSGTAAAWATPSSSASTFTQVQTALNAATGSIDVNSQKITDLAAPTPGTSDACTALYAESLGGGGADDSTIWFSPAEYQHALAVAAATPQSNTTFGQMWYFPRACKITAVKFVADVYTAGPLWKGKIYSAPLGGSPILEAEITVTLNAGNNQLVTATFTNPLPVTANTRLMICGWCHDEVGNYVNCLLQFQGTVLGAGSSLLCGPNAVMIPPVGGGTEYGYTVGSDACPVNPTGTYQTLITPVLALP